MKFKRLRVAVVDDEAQVRKALERLMRGAGFEVRTHACGAEFLVSLVEQAPDCLVLDLHMPEMSGFDVQESLRASGSRVPVVVMTGHDSLEAADRAISRGAFAYLRKPVDGPELIAVITRAVAGARR